LRRDWWFVWSDLHSLCSADCSTLDFLDYLDFKCSLSEITDFIMYVHHNIIVTAEYWRGIPVVDFIAPPWDHPAHYWSRQQRLQSRVDRSRAAVPLRPRGSGIPFITSSIVHNQPNGNQLHRRVCHQAAPDPEFLTFPHPVGTQKEISKSRKQQSHNGQHASMLKSPCLHNLWQPHDCIGEGATPPHTSI
jgi:hypothetical protein